MKPVRMPMSLKSKVAEVFVQILWTPVSAIITAVTIAPIVFLFLFFFPDYLTVDTRRIYEALGIIETMNNIANVFGWMGWFCWLPFILERLVLMPIIKTYKAQEDYSYNVGESDTVKEHDVWREVRDSSGRLVGHTQDKEYEVVHDDGNRSSLSGEAWGLIFYCIFALPLRCISLLLSVFALFIPKLFVCVRPYSPGYKKSYWHIFLDVTLFS